MADMVQVIHPMMVCLLLFAALTLTGTQTWADSLSSDSIILKKHVEFLTTTQKPRYYKNTDILDSVASYIKTEFINYGFGHVAEQSYLVKENTYRNVIASVGPRDAELIVIGAHYDVCGEAPGADDNASGVAGLLETARIILHNRDKLRYRYEFVAYSLEEPPFFRTRSMGSYVHATYLSDNFTKVKLMISYDMIGYFSDEKNSQEYPIGLMKLQHGTKGDFIACITNLRYGRHARKLSKFYNTRTEIRSIHMIAPSFLGGVDFSDHRNYWGYKMPALMISDGAFYRNKNYHTTEDTMDKLNFSKMAQVVNGCAKYIYTLR
jgi:Zn-dependent M28 family amino/carboxypeptidase